MSEDVLCDFCRVPKDSFGLLFLEIVDGEDGEEMEPSVYVEKG